MSAPILSFFVFGTIIASFVGVIAGRLNTGSGFITGRSRCDACSRELSGGSLVPVISYLGSRGRAHCCGAKLSWLSPLSELLLGALFVLAYQTLGLTLALPLMFASLALILALVLYDLAHQILPFPLLTPFVLVSAVTGYLLAGSLSAFVSSVLVALGIAVFFSLIHLLSRGRAMGLADAPFAFGLALLTGPVAFSGLIFSFWIGAVIGIAILLRRASGSRMGVEVPFAPFLAAGFLLAYFTQWNILNITAALP